MRNNLKIQTFLQLLGPLPIKSPLNVHIVEEVDCGTFVRKKITFSSEAHETISAYLCLPKKAGPLPAIYCFHQHAGNHLLGKSEVVGLAGSPDQAYAKELAERGFITLSPDAICFEERAETGDPFRFHIHQLTTRLIQGKTLLGKVLFDVSAGIDLLTSLSEVDSNRIGFIGHSYGGRTALFAPVFDRRIKAAVCSCGSTSFSDMLRHDTGIQFDFVVPDMLTHGDIPDIVRLVEPANLLIVGTDDDKWGMSMPAIQAQAQDAFKEGKLEIRSFAGKHQFSVEMRELAYGFLGEWV